MSVSELKKALSTVGIVAITVGTFFSASFVFAAPPSSAYLPGETLNPTCAPGDANCTVAAYIADFFIATSTTASSTFANGINLTAGCFSVNGTCITSGGGGGSGTVNSGSAGQVTYYAANGTAVSGAGGLYWDNTNSSLSIGTSTTSSLSKLTVDGSMKITSSNGSVVIGDVTGNARGSDALDFQTLRSANTEVASGNESVALGLRNIASGNWSIALGSDNTATGVGGLIVGTENSSDSNDSMTFGHFNFTDLGASRSLAVGYANTVESNAQRASALGYGNFVYNQYGSAIGYNNVVSGDQATAVGYINHAEALAASAFGYSSNAYKQNSTAVGYLNFAYATNTSAFGYRNEINGLDSSGFGNLNYTMAGAARGLVVGYGNTVSATGSAIFGHNITNSIASSTMIGPSDAAKLTILYSGLTGIGTTSPTSKLTVYGDMFLEGASRFLNFGTMAGSSGYGVRDNAGVIEFKNSSGSWASIGSVAGTNWAVPYRGARVRKSANQAISAGTFTAVTWDIEDRDSNSFWTSGASTRMTIPSGVTKIRLHGNVGTSQTTSGQTVHATFYKNGSIFPGSGWSGAEGGNSAQRNIFTDVIDVTPGDYFEMIVWVSNAMNVTTASTTWFALDVVESTDAVTLSTVGGTTTQIQFNSNGSFAADSNFIWNNTSKRLGLGSSTPSARLSVTQSANTNAGGIWISETGNTDFRSIYMDTSGVLSFNGGDTAGTLNTATLNAAGEWTNASDASYKDNVTNLKYGLKEVLALVPRSYTIKATDNKRIGFIAQEVEAVIPEVVSGIDGSKGISYGNLAALTVSAMQDMSKIFGIEYSTSTNALTSMRLDSIELRLTDLEKKNGFFGNISDAITGFFSRISTKELIVKPDDITKAGITTYDRKTGEAVCMFVEDGVVKSVKGNCESSSISIENQSVQSTSETTSTTTPEVIEEANEPEVTVQEEQTPLTEDSFTEEVSTPEIQTESQLAPTQEPTL